MTRLAGITSLYALIAALLLVTPLSASDDPVPEPAPPPEAVEQPQDAVAEPTEPAPTVPEAAPPEPPPGEVTPSPEPARVPPPSPEPAASAMEGQEQPVQRKRGPRRSTKAPRATAAADTRVTISDFQFAPASVIIDVGDTVTWTNEGPTPHSATADDGSFDTDIFDAGQSRSETFDEAGTFAYFCTPHPNMRGTVTVRVASAGGGSGGGGGDGGGSGGSGTSGTGSGTSGAGSGTPGDSSGTALPATGLDTGGLALLGLMTLALGALLRRRAASAE